MKSTIPSTIEIRENIYDTHLIKADPTQISQILMNLGANAAHAIDGGAGVLDITMKTITIDPNHKDRHRVPGEGKYVNLIVEDTGCGISPLVISRVFDPYYTTKEESNGSGMGLAVVHGIVEAHDGAVWVNSEQGKGSVFQMLFPAIEIGITQEIDRSDHALKGNERILLVDDEEGLLTVETALLKRLGYEVTATTSSIKALEMFREQPDQFDLVYTDMTMPHMTGLTLAKKLTKIRPHVPVILYSGLADMFEPDDIGKNGIRAFFKKPMSANDRVAIIREILEDEKRKAQPGLL